MGRAVLWLCVVTGCADHAARAPVVCGGQTCGPDQLCALITAGQVCDGGGYTVLRAYCMDRPAGCGDTVSCDCIPGCSLATGEGRPCLSADDRSVSCGCF